MKSQLTEYIDEIENQIDLRYESFVDSLETYPIEFKSELFKFKKKFWKVNILIEFVFKNLNFMII